MKIHLEEAELREAVILYIESEGIGLSDKEVDVKFTAGRNPVAHSADVEIRTRKEETTDVSDTDDVEDDDSLEGVFNP